MLHVDDSTATLQQLSGRNTLYPAKYHVINKKLRRAEDDVIF